MAGGSTVEYADDSRHRCESAATPILLRAICDPRFHPSKRKGAFAVCVHRVMNLELGPPDATILFITIDLSPTQNGWITSVVPPRRRLAEGNGARSVHIPRRERADAATGVTVGRTAQFSGI